MRRSASRQSVWCCDPYLRRWFDQAIIEATALASDRRTLSLTLDAQHGPNQPTAFGRREEIHIRMQKINMAIAAAMADHMPTFHQLLSTAQPADMDN